MHKFYIYTHYIQERENIMYLSQSDIIAITIALGTSLTLMIIMLYANVQLLRENRFLKTRLRIWRKRFQGQGVN